MDGSIVYCSLCNSILKSWDLYLYFLIAYGYGGLMVLIISLLSLLGVALLPFMQRNSRLSVIYKHLIAILIAMGAAALVSDALIHLIPGVS